MLKNMEKNTWNRKEFKFSETNKKITFSNEKISSRYFNNTAKEVAKSFTDTNNCDFVAVSNKYYELIRYLIEEREEEGDCLVYRITYKINMN
jgi:hypothetical protein